LREPLALGEPMTELEATAELSAHAVQNEVWRNFIGMGYYGTHTPAVIQRNVFENPGWYTAYTPYQAEISQGRLEALLNFQQMVIDLTGLPVANASLLDEATAAAEAMAMIRRLAKSKATAFFVDAAVHPQVIAVMRTRAKWLGSELVVAAADQMDPTRVFGAHFQYPDTYGRIRDWTALVSAVRAAGGLVSIGTDLLALMLIRSPGAYGADIAIGSAQRFGVPLGYGGPHAAFMACRDEHKRSMPGRIIGVSRDAAGRPALRMALQTREQHIRREKATSNICTAQALLANMASFYAVYHGPKGLARIATRANFMARLLVACARSARVENPAFFDTVVFQVASAVAVRVRAQAKRINLRYIDGTRVGVSCDETTSIAAIADVAEAITGERADAEQIACGLTHEPASIPAELRRRDPVLTHPVFNRYHTETEMMRYLKRLENRDFSLVHGMIPLGSCTMKLNAAAELIPLSWPKFATLHPYAPPEQARGTRAMLAELGQMLTHITGFSRVSLQPNSGAQGEYAGLLAIRSYYEARGEARDVCLIPASAHGTNPASAQMMGLRIVVVACDRNGNVDL
ncbi:MAG TPA: glycine dehydrogenase (aminomethyl-transferring), partial [Burkholderiales bacterium]|nr:glycine dehydrogenase (aminomethyl-transferring) [Burkholderiales bacterium]